MNISNFFKILNYKIKKYEEMTINPFAIPKSYVFIWIEDSKPEDADCLKDF